MDTQTISQLIVAISQGLVDEKDAVNVAVDEPAEDGTVVFHLRHGPCHRQAGTDRQGHPHRCPRRRQQGRHEGGRGDRLSLCKSKDLPETVPIAASGFLRRSIKEY